MVCVCVGIHMYAGAQGDQKRVSDLKLECGCELPDLGAGHGSSARAVFALNL